MLKQLIQKPEKEVLDVDKENQEPTKREDQKVKERKIKSSGTQSPSSEDLSRMEKLTKSLISSDFQFQLKKPKLLINFWQTNLNKKSWKLNPFKNKPKQVKELDSKPLPLLVMELTSLVWDGNATNKFKELLKVLSLWLN